MAKHNRVLDTKQNIKNLNIYNFISILNLVLILGLYVLLLKK